MRRVRRLCRQPAAAGLVGERADRRRGVIRWALVSRGAPGRAGFRRTLMPSWWCFGGLASPLGECTGREVVCARRSRWCRWW